jgi:serine/threonine protein kinase
MDGGDLGQYLKKLDGKLLDEDKIWDFFIQTCLGIQYLHTRKILHRDLKTINLFLTKSGKVKIGDLGVAKEVKESHTHTVVGTPYYLSPEL